MTAPTSTIGDTVVNAAKKWVGNTPYAWGGGDMSGPTLGIRDGGVADAHGDYLKVGFDCSGLTQYAWGQVGINIGGDSTTQRAKMVKIDAPQKGCVIWWPGHVAIYESPSSIVEASQSGTLVKVSPFRSGTYLWPRDAANASPVPGSNTGGSTVPGTDIPIPGLGNLGDILGISWKALVVVGLVIVLGGMLLFSVAGGD